MNKDFVEYIKATFDNLENLDIEKMQSIALETSAYLESLGEVMTNGDEKAKEAAMAAALEMKEYLEAKAQNVMRSAGITPESLEGIADDPAFNDAEKNAILDISEALNKRSKSNASKLKTNHLR